MRLGSVRFLKRLINRMFVLVAMGALPLSSVFGALPPGSCYSGPAPYTGAPEFEPSGVSFHREINPADEADLPDEWDWRDVNGFNWLTPVGHQLNCGNCVMQGLASTIEAQIKISSGLPWLQPRLSINEGFHCGGGDCSTGWFTLDALKRAKSIGFVDHACGATIDSPDQCATQTCPNANQRRWKIQDYKTVTNGTLDRAAIRRALLHGPVISGMGIYEDLACYRWGVYRKEVNTPATSGHVLTIVGYSKSKKAWIVKNSWGTWWGDEGYGYIYEHDTSGIGTRSWSVYVPPSEGAVEITNVAENATLSKTIDLRMRSSITQTGLTLRAELRTPAGASWSEECEPDAASSACNVTLHSVTLSDGAYELIASLVRHGQTTTQSMPKQIQIANQKPAWHAVKSMARVSFSSRSSRDIHVRLPMGVAVRPDKIEVQLVDAQGRVLFQTETRDTRDNVNVRIDARRIPKRSARLVVKGHLDTFTPVVLLDRSIEPN